MSRFHRKYHSHNHHSSPTPGYPQSGTDPIASADSPFKGDFHLSGNLIADQMILSSARINTATFESLSSIELSALNFKYSGNLLNESTYTDGSNSGYVGLGYQGFNTGVYSVTLGYQNSAVGDYSLAVGYQNYTQFLYGTAIGYQNKTYGLNSIALGTNNIAVGDGMVAIGDSNYVTGNYTYAVGFRLSSYGWFSLGLGQFVEINHDSCYVYGNKTVPNIVKSQRNRQYLVSANGGVDLGEDVYIHGDFDIYSDQGVTLLESDESDQTWKSYYNQSTDKEKILSSFITNPPIVKKASFGLSSLASSYETADSPLNVINYSSGAGSKINIPTLSSFSTIQSSLILSDPALSANDYGLEMKIVNKTADDIFVVPDGDTIDDGTPGQEYSLLAGNCITFIGNVKTREWFTC